jgi:hypothetical protein
MGSAVAGTGIDEITSEVASFYDIRVATTPSQTYTIYTNTERVGNKSPRSLSRNYLQVSNFLRTHLLVFTPSFQ